MATKEEYNNIPTELSRDELMLNNISISASIFIRKYHDSELACDKKHYGELLKLLAVEINKYSDEVKNSLKDYNFEKLNQFRLNTFK